MRRFSVRHVLAALAWLGLALAPLAAPAGATASMEITEAAAMDMPDGMPCCPETQKKPDCAKDCPLMALCAVKIMPGTANGAALAAPFWLATLIMPGDAAKLSGFAQAPPPKPPKA